MADKDTSLPAGFEDLQPFVAKWALPTANERAAMRGDANPDDRAAFYTAASARVEQALDHLDATGLANFSAADERLMRLMLSLTHVAMTAEVHGDMEHAHAPLRASMPITRAPADL